MRAVPPYHVRCAASLLVTALASSAHAGVLVHWRAPPQCPSSAEVDARVAHRVGATREVEPIDVDVRADAGGFVAQLDDARTLASASCDELADAVALVVARMVLAQPRAAAIVAVATPPPPPDDVTIDAAIDAPAQTPPAPTEWRAGIRISAARGGGAQPGVGLGGEPALPIAWREWFVDPAGSLWKSTTAANVSVALRTATLRVGRRWRGLPLRAWLAADLGELVGQGEDVMDARTGAGAWIGLGAGAVGTWRVADHVALVGGIELLATVARPTFLLATGDVLFQPDAVSARLVFGVEASWP